MDGPRRVDSRSTGQDSHLVRTRWGAEMLCFNYTVGFSWSVAVLSGLYPSSGPAPSAEGRDPGCPEPQPSASGAGEPGSTQSHPLSRGYRAVLPTSLGDVLFSLEVACFGDLMRSSVRRPVCRAGPLPGAPGAAPVCVCKPMRGTTVGRAPSASAPPRPSGRVEGPPARAWGRGPARPVAAATGPAGVWAGFPFAPWPRRGA